jgi:hypothetical protein
LDLIRENAAFNGCSTDVMQLPRRTVSADLELDFVVGSEVCYAANAVASLAHNKTAAEDRGEANSGNFKHCYNLHEAVLKVSAEEFGLDWLSLSRSQTSGRFN